MGETSRLSIKNGLRVLVTAGAAGIGRKIAETFSDAGARVHVCDISQAALDDCAATRPDMSQSRCDVSRLDQVDELFRTVIGEFGGLDVLVNNAGIAGPTGAIDEIDPDDWLATVNVNLNAQFYCARHAAPLLKASGEGSMINMSSVAGRLGYAYRTPYAATKWAVVGLTKSLAVELGPDGVRVNAILPGIVEGPRIDSVISARANVAGVSYDTMKQDYLDKVSLKRMVTAQDIADMALFLCTPAGANISGQALSICGNVEVL